MCVCVCVILVVEIHRYTIGENSQFSDACLEFRIYQFSITANLDGMGITISTMWDKFCEIFSLVTKLGNFEWFLNIL